MQSRSFVAVPASATLALALILSLAPRAHAQAAYVETFEDVGTVQSGADGPSKLVSKGWIFRNQSEPKGSSGWAPGAYHAPQAGSGYLGASSLATDFFGGKISLWAILPAVPGQQAGDALNVYARAEQSTNVDILEVRYSPSGGKSTGSGAAAVGNFTTLLATSNPLPTTGWVKLSATVPGPGAIALRYVVASACNFGCFSSQIGVDTLSVGPEPPPPCNLPPIPQAGAAATWKLAGSPYRICSDLTIPAGATVVVDPGVTVTVDPGRTLGVAGTLMAHGTAAAPITFSGMNSTVTPPIKVAAGTGLADLDHFVMSGRFQLAHGGSALFANSSFPGGIVSSDDLVGGGDHGTFVAVSGCDFHGGQLFIIDGTLAVRDTTFDASTLELLRGYVYLDDLQWTGGGNLSLTRERYTQPAYIDRVAIGGVNGPALDLMGWDFFLGANNAIAGNDVPVRVQDGGLLGGSTVPATGNTKNWVDAGAAEINATAHWGKLAVPYVISGASQSYGAWYIDPGVRVELTGSASPMRLADAPFLALGTPQEPIRFVRHSAGTPWQAIVFGSNGAGPRFEHCLIDGGTNAVIVDDGILHVASTTFQNNATGYSSATYGIAYARSCRFLANGKGVNTTQTSSADLDGQTNPNLFIGNGIAVNSGGSGASSTDATHDWWNSPTGPKTSANPGGTGDPIAGAVAFQPFLTSPPDTTDSPPIVRMERMSDVVETGRKVIVHWKVEDDHALVSQRIIYSPHGDWESFFFPVVADLPPTARSYEWTVPVVLPSSVNEPTFLRVIAVDDKGQEAFDEKAFFVPYTQDVDPSSLTFTSSLAGPFTFGDDIHVCWTYSGPGGTWDSTIVIDGELEGVPYGGGTTLIDCWDFKMPYVSTDRARIRIIYHLGAGGRDAIFYSPPFAIRPDARIGDDPPVIALTSPSPGSQFGSNGVVDVGWTATDDEALRSFTVQASYDGGRTWHMIAEKLPPTATSYAWKLPQSGGIANAIVRVVAFDRRFQNSSDEAPIAISAAPTVCQAIVGAGGPGELVLSACGAPLATGGTATLLLTGAPAGAPFLLIGATQVHPTPAYGGTLYPLPAQLVVAGTMDAAGQFKTPVPGGHGPVDLYVQAVAADPSLAVGIAISNALKLTFLP